MTSIMGMAKGVILLMFVILLAVDLNEAARNKNRPRKNRLNRQAKRQKNSETSLVTEEESGTEPGECMDLNKKVLRMKYETGVNGTNLSGIAMLPASARPTHRGITFAAPTAAPRAGTCPNTLQENYDGNRWPRMIMENSCSCSQCNLKLRPPGTKATCPAAEDESSVGYCRPIMRDIAVLRRAGCVGDFARYEWDVVNVSVGCECVIGSRPHS